ncbi:MAG: OmpH family outer membrane protein [Cytophagales bacterium]|nr:OmpH family outer membrane protein [Cytophagales bacterium]
MKTQVQNPLNRIVSRILLGLILCGGLINGKELCAQTANKTGYTSVEYILSLLPESKSVEADLESYKKQLTARLDSKMEEFKRKGEDLQRNHQNMNDLERADKQEELQILQQSILKFQQESERSMAKKQEELLKPLFDKIQRAIDKVSEQYGYAYVFKAEALLYAKEGDDISNLILKELGITPPPDPPKKK